MPTYKTKKGTIKSKPISKAAQKLLGMKPIRKKASGGKVATPKTKTQAFADYKKKHGYHHKADPKHPMNSERTGAPKKMAKGGKLKMVEKNGKKVPFYAADGVGKMAKGGSVKVKSGDTLSQIAKKKGVTLKSLLAANPGIKNANQIRVGQSIKIPGAAAGAGAKSSNPYKGMSKTQMNMMDVKNKDRGKQEAVTRAMRTQVKSGGAPTSPTPSKAKAVKEKKSGFGALLDRARKARDKKKAAKRPPIPSNDIAAKKGGMMKAKGYKHGGTVRGAGAATKGKRYGRCG